MPSSVFGKAGGVSSIRPLIMLTRLLLPYSLRVYEWAYRKQAQAWAASEAERQATGQDGTALEEPGNEIPHQRFIQAHKRFHVYEYDDLLKRDKMSLDLFWLRDERLEGADALPTPDILAASIVEDLQAALEQFAAIAEELGNGVGKGTSTIER